MKQKNKLIVLVSTFCFVLASCLIGVFAAKNIDINSEGTIEFIAPGVSVTVSEATLSNVYKKEGSGAMKSFTITGDMSDAEIAALEGVRSWNGIKLFFDSESEGKSKLEFTVTNNSAKNSESVMVHVASNTDSSSQIQVVSPADFCVGPNSSHTFSIDFIVQDSAHAAMFSGFKLAIEMSTIKSSQIKSISEYSSKGFSFSTNLSAKTATHTKYTGTATTLEIPAVIKDANYNVFTVTEIASGTYNSNAFYSAKTTLSSITLPDTLTKIGDYAFYDCTKLSGNLTIPNSLSQIGNNAFQNCAGFTGDLVIPNSVITIGNYAFSFCKGFNGKLILGYGLESIGTEAFYYCDSFVGELNLNITKNISTNAFGNCTGFTELYLPEGITKIQEKVFSGCSGLSGSLEIPNTVTQIGDYAFENCTGLNGELILQEGLKSIGTQAFWGCSNICGDLTIPNTVSTMGTGVFRNCTGFNGVLTIGEGLETLNNYMFAGCTGFKGTLVIPETIKTLGNNVFEGCTGFTYVTLSSTLTTIGDSAFSGCTGLLGALTIPNSVISIGDSAFLNCTGLTGVLQLSENLETIGNNAFSGGKFSSIRLNKAVPPTLLGDACFDGITCSIYVPTDSVETYKTATNWSEYASRIYAIT